MKNEIKLSEERIHLWLSRVIRSGLEEKGYETSGIDVFLQRIETLGLEQLRRRIVMQDFLAANAEYLRESTREYLVKGEGAAPATSRAPGAQTPAPMGERPPVEGDLFFTVADVSRYITGALMLTTGDDPGLIVDTFHAEEDSWEDIGNRFAEDIVQKVSRYPPGGFRCRKFGKGFMAEHVDVQEGSPAAADDHADATDSPCPGPDESAVRPAPTPLPEILLEFAVPVLEKRFHDLHDEKGQQEKSMAELKDVIRKLRREIKGLEKKVKKENRETVRLDRQLRQTRKRMKGGGDGGSKSSPGGEDGYMFG